MPRQHCTWWHSILLIYQPNSINLGAFPFDFLCSVEPSPPLFRCIHLVSWMPAHSQYCNHHTSATSSAEHCPRGLCCGICNQWREWEPFSFWFTGEILLSWVTVGTLQRSSESSQSQKYRSPNSPRPRYQSHNSNHSSRVDYIALKRRCSGTSQITFDCTIQHIPTPLAESPNPHL